ncbi:hypothetical protein FQN54_008519 [Arachnomyces sp. PD_36]|nr:hypothetical protein FQN54_008519 [Arachnomyces sp. PD_36]
MSRDDKMTPTNDPKPHEEEEDEDEDNESSENDEPSPLATSRPKRSRAGALMAGLLNAEADDDEIAAIFAEEDDDEEFDSAAVEAGEEGEEGEGGGAAGDDDEDMRMDSSSDDEDEEEPGKGNEEEGEEELRKQDRVERLKRKRKEHEGLKFMAVRKRARVEARPSAAGSSAPRPKKKSERISWLPTAEEGPVRASSRRQTMQNKELTHARLKDSEEKRVRLIATMEEAARRKEKLKPKEMTQEDRLAEAAKTERLNSKSLNRWEEMEKKKSEEQRARLEALQNRRLEGPVLSWWSGIAQWVNGKLTRVGNFEVTQVPEKEPTRRKKANPESPKGARAKKGDKTAADAKGKLDVAAPSPAPSGQSDTVTKGKDAMPAEPPQRQITFAPPQGPEDFLDGIYLYASMPAETSQAKESAPTTPAAPQTQQQPSQPEPEAQSQSQSQPQPQPTEQAEPQPNPQPQPEPDTKSPAGPQPQPQPEHASPAPPPPDKMDIDNPPATVSPAPDSAPTTTTEQPQQPQEQQDQPAPATTTTTTTATSTTDPPPPPPPTLSKSTRNLIILENFDSHHTTLPETSILFNTNPTTSGKRATKLSKPPPPQTCVITSQPARYRDPETGLPYANAYAYREIRRLLGNQFVWSRGLGCFVGPVGLGARGVPGRFLGVEGDGDGKERRGNGGDREMGKEGGKGVVG